jgi:hypothetical protein
MILNSRHTLLAAALLVFLSAPAAAQLVGTDTSPGDSCAGFPAGATRVTADADQNGGDVTLICDGTVWQPATGSGLWSAGSGDDIYYNSGTPKVGIGTGSPAAALQVAGEAIVGYTGLGCSGSTEGAIRWSSSEGTIEMCDGITWQKIVVTATAGCTGPNAFAFTDVTDAPLSTFITSDSVTPSGCAQTLAVSVTGGGNPQVSVDNGPWVTSTTIDAGQSLRVRLASSASNNTPLQAVVSIGSTTGTTWTVTTKAGNTRIFMSTFTHNGNLGGLAAADALCQSDAAGLGYGSSWRAVLSDSWASAKDRLSITYPVVRADSPATTVAATDLWSGSLANGVTGGGSDTWTATFSDGSRSTVNCSDWTTSSSGTSGRYGKSNSTSNGWTDYGTQPCDNNYRLYCIEQPDPGCSASAFSFTDQTGAAVSTQVTSNTITPSGCASDSTVAVYGNSAEVSINGGAWASTGTLSPGDTLQVRLTTGGNYSYADKADIFIGNTESLWSVTTEAGGTRIFITGSDYNGNFGGLSGADAICASEASSFGYSGNWVALLSTSSVDAKDRLVLTYPVVRATNGVVIASLNLWSGSLSNSVGGNKDPWTGTKTDGTYSGSTCSGWTTSSSGGFGTVGSRTVTGSTWVEGNVKNCDHNYGLYCVEQPSGVTILGFAPSSQSGMDVTGPGSPAYGTPVTFTLTNSGTSTSGTLSTSLIGANFEIVTDNCAGTTLGAGADCTIDVRPAASADGNYTGTLTVNDSVVSTSVGVSGTASGFGSNVAGFWLEGATADEIYYNSGNIGVGTNDPAVALDVIGTVKVGDGGETCDGTLAGAMKYDAGFIYMCDGANWEAVNTGAGGKWLDALTAGDIFYSSGSVGVGTNDPKAPLQVVGEAIVGYTGLGCSGTTEGAIRYDSAGTALSYCDGTAWQTISSSAGVTAAGNDRQIQFNSGGVLGADTNFVFTSAGRLGIGTNAPKAPLDVGGEAIIGASTGLPCDADREGGLRWNATDKTVEMCDGSTWRKIAATTAAADCTPDAFSFTDLTDQPFSSLILSNTVNITGIDAGCTVSVSGGGTPKISVNGGAWVTATAIGPGDTLRVQLISSGLASTELIAGVTVGTATDNWSVTTKAGGTRIFETANTYTGNLGGIGAAHAICQTEAGSLGYSGLFRALLSNDFVNAKDMLTITYPVVRAVDGVTVDSANLWDGAIQNPVVAGGSGSYTTWTGSDSDGTVDSGGSTCLNWRSASAGETGKTGRHGETNTSWFGYASGTGCNVPKYLYCVDQPSALGAILGILPSSKSGMNVFGTGSPAYGDAVTFTMENTGDTVSDTIATSLSNTANFEFVTDNCNGQTLAPGATCTVSIRPKATLPGGEGPISGTFNVTADNNPSVSLSGTAATGGLRIFRTATLYTGNLGGIGAAHALCQSEAGTLGYSGLWRALLSNDFVDAKDMLTITYPVVRAADGVIVDSASLWDGSIQNPVTAGGGLEAWTGTAADGTLSGLTSCQSWRSGSSGGTGTVGRDAYTNSGWVDYTSGRVCSDNHYLYCIEQAAAIGGFLGILPSSKSGMNVFGTGSPAYGDAVTFTMENAGDTVSDTIATSLSNTANFEFVTDNCNGQTLAPGATCTVSIRPKATVPGGEGPISGTFNVTADNNPGGVSLSGTVAAGATKIFHVTTTYSGNLGGLSGADAICQSEAGTLGYSGTWKAILSDSTTNAKDRLTITYPVVRAADGVIVDSLSLWDGSIGNTVGTSGEDAWTGSNSDGTKNANTCSDWSSTSGNGEYGHSDYTDSTWVNASATSCGYSRGLYCVDGQ